MLKLKEIEICFKSSFLFVFVGFTGCIEAPQPKPSSLKVTNSEALEDTDLLSVVRLGNDCTAIFFKPNLAVTSAACAQKHNSFTSASGQIHPIKAKIIHPFYKANQPLGPTNLAILQIESRFLPRYPGSPQLALWKSPGPVPRARLESKHRSKWSVLAAKTKTNPKHGGSKEGAKMFFCKSLTNPRAS